MNYVFHERLRPVEYKFGGKSNEGGVYRLRNKLNERVYVGSAKCFKVRWNQHTASLRRGKHSNRYLQADFDKCGEEVFVFEVLEVVGGTKEDRLLVEQRYIDSSFGKNKCYNLRKDASSPHGSKKVGKQYSNIQLLSPDLILYTSVDSVTSFAEEHHLNPKCLWKLLNRQAPSTKGWTLVGTEKKKLGPKNVLKGSKHPNFNKHHTEESKQKNRLAHLGKKMGTEHHNSKTYLGLQLIGPDGVVITEIQCLAAFCRLYGLAPTKLCAVLKGRRKSTKGWSLATISSEIL